MKLNKGGRKMRSGEERRGEKGEKRKWRREEKENESKAKQTR